MRRVTGDDVVDVGEPYVILKFRGDRKDPPCMSGSQSEVGYLRQAIRLAVDNAAAGRLPFGAVVVRAGEVISTGVNTEERDSDPTAHAEVAAIRSACAAVGATRE